MSQMSAIQKRNLVAATATAATLAAIDTQYWGRPVSYERVGVSLVSELLSGQVSDVIVPMLGGDRKASEAYVGPLASGALFAGGCKVMGYEGGLTLVQNGGSQAVASIIGNRLGDPLLDALGKKP